MPEADIRDELQVLHIYVQEIMQLRSRRRDQDAENDHVLTPHFILSMAGGSDVAEVRLLIAVSE
jgi:hypothetical protein